MSTMKERINRGFLAAKQYQYSKSEQLHFYDCHNVFYQSTLSLNKSTNALNQRPFIHFLLAGNQLYGSRVAESDFIPPSEIWWSPTFLPAGGQFSKFLLKILATLQMCSEVNHDLSSVCSQHLIKACHVSWIQYVDIVRVLVIYYFIVDILHVLVIYYCVSYKCTVSCIVDTVSWIYYVYFVLVINCVSYKCISHVPWIY